MEDREPYISSFVRHLLPDASEAEQRAAQANVDNFVAVLYRICDRLARDEAESARDKRNVYARLESTKNDP